jgi:hypothetical protein
MQTNYTTTFVVTRPHTGGILLKHTRKEVYNKSFNYTGIPKKFHFFKTRSNLNLFLIVPSSAVNNPLKWYRKVVPKRQ